MNKQVEAFLQQPDEPWADYQRNTKARIDTDGEALRHQQGQRVGISRPHESAHLHVAGSAAYIDDLPELAGTLHAALGLSPVAHGRLKGVDVEKIRALPGVVAVLTAADIPASTTAGRSSTTTPSWRTARCTTWGSRCSPSSPPTATSRAAPPRRPSR